MQRSIIFFLTFFSILMMSVSGCSMFQPLETQYQQKQSSAPTKKTQTTLKTTGTNTFSDIIVTNNTTTSTLNVNNNSTLNGVTANTLSTSNGLQIGTPGGATGSIDATGSITGSNITANGTLMAGDITSKANVAASNDIVATNNISANNGSVTANNGTLSGAYFQLTQPSLTDAYLAYAGKAQTGKTQMIPIDKGFCFLTATKGKFEGGGEYVTIIIENNYWVLQATAGNAADNYGISAEARCFLYKRA